MNTNGGTDTTVDEDWHAFLEREMDARGPGFEVLVDKLVPDLHCPREKVRLWLHVLLTGFAFEKWADESYGSADPINWLNQVLSAAEQLEKLLQINEDPDPSPTVELADLRFKGHLLGELRRLISAAKQRLAEITEEANADARRGRPPDRLRRDLVQSILRFYTECRGRLPGKSRQGPANRLVIEVCRFLGWKANSEVVYGWIREAMTP
jgi:hypothetical protein